MQSRTILGGLALVTMGACGDRAEDAPSTSESALQSNLPCDVQEIINANCIQCHGTDPKAGAPMSLASQPDWAKVLRGQKVATSVGARIHDPVRPMPPGKRLGDSELAVLDRWIAAGAPAGECKAKVAPTAEAPPCEADTILRAPTPYSMGLKDDQYVCFGVDISVAQKRHIWAMVPQVDNTNITHHILVFQSEEAVDPKPHECGANGARDWKVMGGWAPGGGSILFPEEAGLPEKPGTTHWVVQVHYNNVARRVDQKDRSGFGLCTTDKLRPHDAGLITFGALRFAIPPRSDHGITCDYPLDERFRGVHFFGGSPHMHQLGKAMFMDKLPGGAPGPSPQAPQKIIDAKDFDFQEQRGSALSVDVAPGDHIQTRCEWKNPGARTVGFGEGTGDEMCLGFINYYPAIEDKYAVVSGSTVPVFNWTSPSNNLPIMDVVRAETGLSIPAPTCHEDSK